MTDRSAAPAADPPPRWAPSARELDDLEMLLLGGYPPLRGFLGPEDAAAVSARGRLVDGSLWPVPVTLVVPGEIAHSARRVGVLVLLDEEGAPLAKVVVERTWVVGDDRHGVAGPVRALRPLERGSHRALRRPASAGPGATRSAPGRVLGVPLDRPLHLPQLAALRAGARELDAQVLLLPLTGHGSPQGVDGSALVRTCLALREPLAAKVVPVAVPRHGEQDRDHVLRALVAAAYGATHVPGPLPPLGEPADALPTVVELPPVARDLRTGEWAPAAEVPVEHRAPERACEVDRTVRGLVTRGEPVPPGLTLPSVVRELRRASRPGGGTGFAVLFTGLSGAGKSTIARAVHDALLERTDRTVTLLDGDVARRMLSSELSFSRPHRELNVRRIGYVAAEVTRHGGVALCAPIAPYATTRAQVRTMVEQHGGFLLVYVATPLEVCEARDRKGLYARARAGLVPAFTGISDPYEPPTDAELTVDTTQLSVAQAVDQVLAAAAARGWL